MHPDGRCILGGSAVGSHAESQWKGQDSPCWSQEDPGKRGKAQGPGVAGKRRREHLCAQYTQEWESGEARAESLWKGQGSLCWPWGDLGRKRALGTGVVGKRPEEHRGTRCIPVGETEGVRAGGTHSQHLMCLGGRERDRTGCDEVVKWPGGHHGAQYTLQAACRGVRDGVIRSQTSGDLGKREKGHTENSEVGKRHEVRPGAQYTQHMVAERTPKRSGEPLVVLGEEALKS